MCIAVSAAAVHAGRAACNTLKPCRDDSFLPNNNILSWPHSWQCEQFKLPSLRRKPAFLQQPGRCRRQYVSPHYQLAANHNTSRQKPPEKQQDQARHSQCSRHCHLFTGRWRELLMPFTEQPVAAAILQCACQLTEPGFAVLHDVLPSVWATSYAGC
jgi:hypothetical protein